MERLMQRLDSESLVTLVVLFGVFRLETSEGLDDGL